MQKQTIDLHEMFQHMLLEIHAAWRYRWHALLVTWCVVVAGSVMVFSLPNQYESQSQVYADTNALTNPLLNGIAVHSDIHGRLQVITRTLLARPNLETVANKTGLALRADSPTDKDALLTKLGASVSIKDAGAKNLYNISYTDTDPVLAQKVVQAFVQILMNDTLNRDSSSSELAQNFLQQQVNEYNKTLNAEEKKIAAFKKANIGFMPGPGNQNYSGMLQDAQSRLQSLQDQYQATLSSSPQVPQHIDPQLDQIDQQIATYQQQLDKLLLSYTEKYPDVVSTRRMIKQLQARRKSLVAHPDSSAATAPSAGANRTGARLLSAQIAAQKQRIADIKNNADRITEAQATFQKLTRNYDTTKREYNELVSRLNTAKLSQQATQSGNNLKFRVISPPIVPLIPAGPHREILLFLVFLIAVGIGAAFGYFLHKINPVFTSLKSLREFDEYPIIGAFSLIESPQRLRTRRREVIGFFAGVSLLAVVLVLGFAYNTHLAHLVQSVFVGGVS